MAQKMKRRERRRVVEAYSECEPNACCLDRQKCNSDSVVQLKAIHKPLPLFWFNAPINTNMLCLLSTNENFISEYTIAMKSSKQI